jgi:hypothetical protein
MDAETLTVTAGVLTLICAVAFAVRVRLTWLRGRVGAAIASVVSEVGNAIGGLSGPSVALYAVNADWPAEQVAPTLQVFGVVTNVVTLAGSTLSTRLSAGSLRTAVLLLARAGGGYAVVRGLSG